jgi:hypothetical protein
MPKNRVSISHMEFVRVNDEMFEVIFDPTVSAYLATSKEQDLVAWLDEKAPLLGESFATYCKTQPPEVLVTKPPPPPQQVKLLLRYALRRKHQEHIIGDLEEAYYAEWLPEHGPLGGCIGGMPSCRSVRWSGSG